MPSVVVVGAGGFGREVLDVLRDQGMNIRGVVDDRPSDENLTLLAKQDIEFLGGTSVLVDGFAPHSIEYLIGVGSGSARRAIDERLTSRFSAATAVHSSATLGWGVSIGEGTIICAGVRVTTNVVLGRHVHLNLNVTVGHDVVVGDYASANPGAAVSGEVKIGSGALIGANAFVLQGLHIGEDSVIGASAAVVRKVEAHTTVAGVPARLLKRN